jgi:hypothetical protein
LAGRYSTVFGDSVLGQSDFGSGRVVIGRKATVRLIGKLDGAQRSFTTSATILQNQQIPFFQRSSIGGSYRRISIGGVLFIDATNATGWFEGNGWIKLDPTATTGLATPDPRIPHDLWFQPQP